MQIKKEKKWKPKRNEGFIEKKEKKNQGKTVQMNGNGEKSKKNKSKEKKPGNKQRKPTQQRKNK